MDDVRRMLEGIIGPRRAAPSSGERPEGVPPPAPPPMVVAAPRGRAPFAVLLVAAIAVLWLSRAVLAPFVVAAVLAYAFSPLVSAGERRTGWPRIAVIGVGYAIAVALIGLVVFLLAGRISAEIRLLAEGGPDALATTIRQLVGSDVIDIGGQRILVADIAREIQNRALGLIASPGDALHVAGQVGEAALQAFLATIVTFYFLVDGDRMMDRIVGLLPVEHRARTVDVVGRIHVILGKWLRGQLFLIAFVSAVTYLVFGPILHLPYALGLAIATGVLEIIPLVGPLVATAIVGVDAFASGGTPAALSAIVFLFVFRQIQDQVIAPVVIGRAVHLHPVVTIFAVLVGLSVYGILGGLLGVPLAAAVNVVFRELYPERPTADDGGPLVAHG
jgi:predicted PurR-regulated permease PerM